mgnify:CR=1 FL=1
MYLTAFQRTAPGTIYLVGCDDPDCTHDFTQHQIHAEVTWCEDEPLDNCAKYIRADIAAYLIDRLVTVENDPTVPAYARKVAADAVRAMGGANADPT